MRRAVATLIVATMAIAGAAAQEPSLDEVLSRAAVYVADYQKRLQGIVAEELYIQNYMRTTRTGRLAREGRQLRSDLLLVKVEGAERWLQFRDVFEVDRRPVRDRDQRLYKLFVDAKADARAQAETVQEESSRYNLGPIVRNINMPILALLFLEKANQSALEFAPGKIGNIKRLTDLTKAEDIVAIEFRDNGPGTMVRGQNNRDLPSNGRFWLDRTNGRILRTELNSHDTQLRALIEVTYKATPGLDFLVPGEMREIYTTGQNETRIDGRATYDKFRQFSVSTTERTK